MKSGYPFRFREKSMMFHGKLNVSADISCFQPNLDSLDTPALQNFYSPKFLFCRCRLLPLRFGILRQKRLLLSDKHKPMLFRQIVLAVLDTVGSTDREPHTPVLPPASLLDWLLYKCPEILFPVAGFLGQNIQDLIIAQVTELLQSVDLYRMFLLLILFQDLIVKIGIHPPILNLPESKISVECKSMDSFRNSQELTGS